MQDKKVSLLSKMSYKTATQFHDKIKTFALYISDNQISMVTSMQTLLRDSVLYNLRGRECDFNKNINAKVANLFSWLLI